VKRVTAAVDPDDDIFLECAEASGADFLITGNLKAFSHQMGLYTDCHAATVS
jgi:hypothetical protein